MRKHNWKFCTRFGRRNPDGSIDRTNAPQQNAHALVHSKSYQLQANALLRGMLRSAGLLVITPNASGAVV